MLGICGMGGVGKTTMAEEIRKRVIEEKLFNYCPMAIIGQKQDFEKIQSDIAEMLELKLLEKNPIARKSKLHQRLEKGRVLVILDDVWEEFDLDVLGITFTKGCKVLYTSRNLDLWRELETKMDFQLNVLNKSESWDLLIEAKVGNTLKDKPELQHVAEEIVKECGGLPLALVTLGSALIGKGEHIWRDTLTRLKNGDLSKAQKVEQAIELSYTFLDDDEVKTLFLLCCLFEEDFEIPVKDLIRMGIGLRMFRGVNNLEQARDRAFTLVEQLKSHYLLLPSKKTYGEYFKTVDPNEYVRMHDVVRDVSKSIAAKKKSALILDNGTRETVWQELDMGKNFTWISIISKEIRELPTELRSSQVKILKCTNGVLQITDDFFEGMGELRDLDLSDMKYPQLPSLLRRPSSLRTLCLRGCDFENITFIGDSTNLEILDLRESKIETFPNEFVHSSSLMSVDLRTCKNLKTIKAGIISRQCQLEELYIGDSYIDWEGGENGEGRNANIREFESLTNLHTLHILIKDASILPTSPLFRNLKKYEIEIGGWKSLYFTSYEKCCSICLHTFVPLNFNIEFLSKNSEELQLVGENTKDLVHKLVRDGCHSLKYLSLFDIDTLEHVANEALLFTLEALSLIRLNNLQQISPSPLVLGSFGKLKTLFVCNCTKLRSVFPLSIVTELVLLNLYKLQAVKAWEK